MSDHIEQIQTLLTELLPIECDILGESVVLELSAGAPLSSFSDAGAGAMLDVSEVLKVAADMATLLGVLLQLREAWNTRQPSPGHTDSPSRDVAQLRDAHSELSAQQKESAIRRIFPDIR